MRGQYIQMFCLVSVRLYRVQFCVLFDILPTFQVPIWAVLICAIAQVVSCGLVMAEVQVQSHVSSYGFVAAREAVGQVFLWLLLFFLVSRHSSNASYLLIPHPWLVQKAHCWLYYLGTWCHSTQRINLLIMRDFRLLPQSRWDLSSSGILRGNYHIMPHNNPEEHRSQFIDLLIKPVLRKNMPDVWC